jgi:hypothetical protein
VLNKHVLLVVHSDASLAQFAVTIKCSFDDLELIHRHGLLGTFLVLKLEVVLTQGEPSRSSPRGTVVSDQSGGLAAVGQLVLLCSVIEIVLNLIDITFPAGHLYLLVLT